MENLLTIYGLSKRLGLPPDVILKRCNERPELLPRFFTLHDVKRWKESDVEQWLAEQKGNGAED